jgi:hypothetical protein
MASKTSIYLTDDMVVRSAATGLTPGEIYRRGLEAIEQNTQREDLEAAVYRAARDEVGASLPISVLAQDGDTWKLAGSFDYRKAERFHSRPGHPDGRHELYRTIDGRWVLGAPADSTADKIVAHIYITDDQARTWLQDNGHDDVLRRFSAPAS